MKTNSTLFDCISAARKDYDMISKIKVDNDYDFDYAPSMMQKFMYDGLKKNRIFCNWSGTGAGKTLSALFAGRKLDCRVMVIICPNDVKDSWESSIAATYPTNSNVVNVTGIKDIKKFDRKVFNYIILNYDKFSVESGKEMVEKMLKMNKIDFLCFDELHFVKVRNANDASKRHDLIKSLRMEAEKDNENIYITGMTATPVINSLSEARSLVELITGKKYPEIGNTKTHNNLYQAYKALNNIGFRYVKNYGIDMKEEVINIDGQDAKMSLIDCLQCSDKILRVEKILATIKMNDPSVLKEIKRGTIIFSYYRDGNHSDAILNIIVRKLMETGISYAIYTGGDNDRDESKKLFMQGKVDVLIATKPISTGVDGLQKVSNRMIMIGYPWTGAEYDQLTGRINRQGSNFKEVTIIHPQVNIMKVNGEVWSYDHHRREVIRTKKELADVVLDGKFDTIYNIHRGKMVSDMLEDLKKGTATDYTPERESL